MMGMYPGMMGMGMGGMGMGMGGMGMYPGMMGYGVSPGSSHETMRPADKRQMPRYGGYDS